MRRQAANTHDEWHNATFFNCENAKKTADDSTNNILKATILLVFYVSRQ